jgi:hypothetical protein
VERKKNKLKKETSDQNLFSGVRENPDRRRPWTRSNGNTDKVLFNKDFGYTETFYR